MIGAFIRKVNTRQTVGVHASAFVFSEGEGVSETLGDAALVIHRQKQWKVGWWGNHGEDRGNHGETFSPRLGRVVSGLQ